ncbi:MAG: endopeptidase La [Spirochaetales bacterium]|nr:endopeptidase La [Spirochaetales bacterium]
MRLFQQKDESSHLPVLPVKGIVLFPGISLPLLVTREADRRLVAATAESGRRLLVVTQRGDTDPTSPDALHPVGTVARILQTVKAPGGTVRIVVEGQDRVELGELSVENEEISAHYRIIAADRSDAEGDLPRLARLVQDAFAQYVALSAPVNPEVRRKIAQADGADRLVNLVATHIPLQTAQKIALLSTAGTLERTRILAETLGGEVELLSLKRTIRDRVRKRMEKGQKSVFLQEQIREINRELGNEETLDENDDLAKQLTEAELPEEVRDRAGKELARLKKLPPVNPESGIIRTYLDWLLALPWSRATPKRADLARARDVLDEDHHAMQKPKERLLEYMAVQTLNPNLKGPILCFVGPPGTGKTSLGRSMARALEREFVRLSLGGVRDEAEVRGHRRTYVGAMPGRIIQAIRRAGTHNPVILLDEIDKLGADYRGDPSAALLEVLDPEQNFTFSDHYIELHFDLSQVTFLTTANSLAGVPPALRDRLEVIEIPGYTEGEKRRIAEEFLIPEELAENGVPAEAVRFRRDAVDRLIRDYTSESGVRNLKRSIATVIRKVAKEMLEKGASPETTRRMVTSQAVGRLLGPPRYRLVPHRDEMLPGLARGVAWTEHGGVELTVEVAVFDGTAELILTGSLGDVMKESAQAALSLLLSRKERLGFQFDRSSRAIHIHVPAGAIPKDGPSAGITLYAALLSRLTDRPIKADLAMTGELTLTGRILPVGGIKEKVLAARRNAITAVILPAANESDLDLLPRDVRHSMRFFPVGHVDEAEPLLFSS